MNCKQGTERVSSGGLRLRVRGKIHLSYSCEKVLESSEEAGAFQARLIFIRLFTAVY